MMQISIVDGSTVPEFKGSGTTETVWVPGDVDTGSGAEKSPAKETVLVISAVVEETASTEGKPVDD